MWQVIAGLLFLAATTGAKPANAQPSIAFAALKKSRSRLPWYFGISVLLHALLLLVLAFAVELVRDSDRELRLSRARGYASIPVAIRIPDRNYYPARYVAQRHQGARAEV